MAAPLILRIITDASQTLKATSAVSSSYTLIGKAALDAGVDVNAASVSQITSSLKVEDALRAQIATCSCQSRRPSVRT